MTAEDYERASMFFTDEEMQTWETCYTKTADGYELAVTDEKRLEELDDEFLVPLVMTYRMQNMSEEEADQILVLDEGRIVGKRTQSYT